MIMMFVFTLRRHALRTYFPPKRITCGRIQTLITRIEGIMIHDVQREIHANNVEHETVDGLCFRGEQLSRQVARLEPPMF